jgi:hypothetical protein
MATRPKFARMANYSCECVEASHIFLKKALWRMWASLASLGKVGWRMLTNVSSPGKTGWRMYRVRPKQVGECQRVWRVLAKPRQMLANDKIGCFKHK